MPQLPHAHDGHSEKLFGHMPAPEEFTASADLFKLMSDGTRIKLFWLLCHCEDCVVNISAMTEMSSPAVSHHLRQLKEAGLISISQGKSGISLTKTPGQITFYDVYKAVDSVNDDGLFHFHENPNPECPIGRNIHKAMDSKLERVQKSMEDEMRKITLADVMTDIQSELKKK